MKNRPAGWYRNASDRRQHGYWDGDVWVDPDEVTPSAGRPGQRLDVEAIVEPDEEP